MRIIKIEWALKQLLLAVQGNCFRRAASIREEKLKFDIKIMAKKSSFFECV